MENEAGARSGVSSPALTGSAGQVEWAERIRCQVDAEFDRVAASLRTAASRQSEEQRAETEDIVAILEDKRAEVMRRPEAGCFIHAWQEIRDQVRQLLLHDARYQAIRSKRAARR